MANNRKELLLVGQLYVGLGTGNMAHVSSLGLRKTYNIFIIFINK